MHPEVFGGWSGYFLAAIFHSLLSDDRAPILWWGNLLGMLAGAVLAEVTMVWGYTGRVEFHPRHLWIRLPSSHECYVSDRAPEVEAWCRDHCRGSWLISRPGFLHLNRKSDYAMFLLFWDGSR